MPEFFTLGTHNIDTIEWDGLPGPEEQLENLIEHWGQTQDRDYGGRLNLEAANLRAKLGAVTAEDVYFVAAEAIKRSLLEGRVEGGRVVGKLTFEGWRFYRDIERGHTRSTHAFMAMPFGFEPITRVVDEVFRPAVKETGFTLKRLDDEPRSGLIDDRLRVEIRQCKFLIAELTHDNRGAYWEAGFAEGLGKPVIYTCEKSYFEDKSKGTHFDTNHCTTVVWDEKDLPRAAEELKATIRNTFPFEAKMPPEPAG